MVLFAQRKGGPLYKSGVSEPCRAPPLFGEDTAVVFVGVPTSPSAIATAVALSPRPSRRLPSPGIPPPTSAHNRHIVGDTTPATAVSPPPTNADWGPGRAADAPDRRRLRIEIIPISSFTFGNDLRGHFYWSLMGTILMAQDPAPSPQPPATTVSSRRSSGRPCGCRGIRKRQS